MSQNDQSTDKNAVPGTEPAADSKPENVSSNTSHNNTTSEPAEGAIESLDLDAEALAQLEELTEDSHGDETLPLKTLLQSSDTPTRFMTFLSMGFALLALICFGLLITLYIKNRNSHQVVKTEVVAPLAPTITQSLGDFEAIVKPIGSEEEQLSISIIAECNSTEVCETVKSHLAEVRDLVVPLLMGLTKEEWLSVDSKTLLRRKITDRINSMTLPGKVLQVDFSDLLIEKRR